MIELEPQAIIEMPLETLALAVLKDYASSHQWNKENWFNDAARAKGNGPHMQVLAEGWAWLESRALVAPNPSQTSPGSRFVTRAGKQVLDRYSLSEVLAAERIGLDLHRRLEGKIRPIFLLGDYETAAFKAMKEVEVRVRELASLPADLVGVKLMRKAFHPEDGLLTDQSHEGGERQARMELFAGAIGSFKNPASHRTVKYDDPTEASEVVLVADLLMRILDSVEATLT